MDWPVELFEGDPTVLVQAIVDMVTWVFLAQLAVLLVGLAVLWRRPAVVRRFWCAVGARDVEVAFARDALALLGAPLRVHSCSAFDPPEAITCDRRCETAGCRLPTQPPRLGLARS